MNKKAKRGIDTSDVWAEKLKEGIDKIIRNAEKSYDAQVTVLLRAVDSAEKKADLKKLKAARNIALTWIEYFETLRDLVKKDPNKTGAGKKASLDFINDQIKFFNILSKEIDRKVLEGKASKIRQSLE